MDIDEMDTMPKPYHQLIVWDPEHQQIIGGYRYLIGTEAEIRDGQPFITSAHLFHYSDRFIRDYLQRFLNDPTIRRFCTCRERGNYLPLLIRAHVDLTLGESGDPVKYYKAFFHNAGVLNLLLECLNSKTVISLNELVEIIHTYSKVMYAEQS